MEKMTDKEIQKLKDLKAKERRIERAKKNLFAEAEVYKEELLLHWGIQLEAPHSNGVQGQSPAEHRLDAPSSRSELSVDGLNTEKGFY